MPFTYTWDSSFEALPADTEAASQGASRIRALKAAISERLEVDHSWAGDASDAKHLKVSLIEGSAPTNAANTGILYTKDDGGDTELYYMDDGGTEVQVTQDGQLKGTGGGLLAALNLSDVVSASTSFGNIKQDATTSATGVVELATAAETLAGSDTTRALTAAGMAGNKSASTNGYYKLPGNIMIQWGVKASVPTGTSLTTITFGTAFASTPYVCVVTVDIGAGNYVRHGFAELGSSSVKVMQESASARDVHWIVIGPTS